MIESCRYMIQKVWLILSCFIYCTLFVTPEANALLAKPAATGQTTSYAAGDDGAIRPGVPWPSPRFTDQGNGTVTDQLTGLVWLKNANCTETVGGVSRAGETLSWTEALAWSSGLASGSCGLTDGSAAADWRLPGRLELESLIDASKYSPALPAGHPFSNVRPSYYWTSTTFSGNTGYAWGIYLGIGYADGNPKTSRFYVWPVRGGQFGDAAIAVTPAAADYGDVPVWGTSSRTVTVSNTAAVGASRLQISALALRGTDPGQFSIDPGDGSGGSCGTLMPVVNPGESCSVTASFRPTVPGSRNAVLRISASDPNTPDTDISLSGSGTGYTISASINGGNGTIASANPLIISGGPAVFELAPDATYQPASAVSGTCPAGFWNNNQYTTGAIVADCTVGFSFTKITYPLTINFSGSGADKVSVLPKPPAVDCTGDCSQTFDIDTLVTLSASALDGYTFTGWSGACSGSGACEISMTTAQNVTAAFADITPPTVSITAPVPALTNNRTPRLSYTVSDGTVAVTLDNTLISIINGDNLPSLSDGSHTVVVAATDGAANVGTASVTFAVDGTAATLSMAAPLPAVPTNSATVTYTLSEPLASGAISFSRSGGSEDPARHRLNLSGANLLAGEHTVANGFALVDGAVYSVTIDDLADLAGNVTPAVTAAGVTYDVTALPAVLLAPTAGSTITTPQVGYSLGEAARSASISFTNTGGATDPGSPLTYTLSGADLEGGSHSVATGLALVHGAVYTVSLAAVDLAGNTVPTVAASTVTYADRFSLTVSKGGLGNGTVTAPAGTGSGISCGSLCSETYLNNTLVTLSAEADAYSGFTGWSGACSGAGICQVTMDGVKNVTAVFADIAAPDTALTSWPADPTAATSFSFTFTSTEAGSTYECSLGGGWNVCASPYSSSIVYAQCTTCRADSQQSFSVRAKDQTGNIDADPATYSWTVIYPLSSPIGSVPDGGMVQLRETVYSTSLIFGRPISFTLKGGYSEDYSQQSGITTINGSITIAAGSITVDGIAIQ